MRRGRGRATELVAWAQGREHAAHRREADGRDQTVEREAVDVAREVDSSERDLEHERRSGHHDHGHTRNGSPHGSTFGCRTHPVIVPDVLPIVTGRRVPITSGPRPHDAQYCPGGSWSP